LNEIKTAPMGANPSTWQFGVCPQNLTSFECAMTRVVALFLFTAMETTRPANPFR
jgi:hypothetical protein